MILEMGIKPYLEGIASSIIGCLKSPATFGMYKIGTLIITGSLLQHWAKLKNKLYADFIWRELEEAFYLYLYKHQIRTQISMTKVDLDLFTDNRQIKLEKYQQVLGKKRVLIEIFSKGNLPAKLYEYKGDRYELVPSINIDNDEYWRVIVAQDDNTVLSQSGISRKFFYVIDKKSREKLLAREVEVDSECNLSLSFLSQIYQQ